MNTQAKIILLATLLCLSIHATAWARGPLSGSPAYLAQQALVSAVPLSAEEAQTLSWMREEEKLARDVYQALYKTWKRTAFKNIALSEQKHMDAMLRKLSEFGLPDPALADAGYYSQPELQALYAQLLAQGGVSYVGALQAGAMIEDMDIADLSAAIAATANVSVQLSYGNLLEGSKRHLRAFVKLLRGEGMDYAPQFMAPELFEAIAAD
jgi:hypothetical protein